MNKVKSVGAWVARHRRVTKYMYYIKKYHPYIFTHIYIHTEPYPRTHGLIVNLNYLEDL